MVTWKSESLRYEHETESVKQEEKVPQEEEFQESRSSMCILRTQESRPEILDILTTSQELKP